MLKQKRIILFAVLASCSGLELLAAGAADEVPADLEVVKKIVLGGEGSWKSLRADSPARRLYIARSNRVMVIDMDAERQAGEIDDLLDAQRIAVASEFNRGFISCGKENSVRVFDLQTLNKTGHINVGRNPDEIIYDAYSKKLFIFNRADKNATVIAASSGKALGLLPLGGIPESGVADKSGKIYINLKDKSEIAVIDTNTQKVTARYALDQGMQPSGLAIDIEHHRLFSACKNKIMTILDADSGKVLGSLPIGAGAEAAEFNAETANAFSSNGEDGTLSVIHESDANTFSTLQTVPTQEGASTMAFDSKKQQVWLVTAKQNDTKEFVAESFTALIVSRHVPVDYGVPFSRKTAAFLFSSPYTRK